jgi:hypothetical protein
MLDNLLWVWRTNGHDFALAVPTQTTVHKIYYPLRFLSGLQKLFSPNSTPALTIYMWHGELLSRSTGQDGLVHDGATQLAASKSNRQCG